MADAGFLERGTYIGRTVHAQLFVPFVPTDGSARDGQAVHARATVIGLNEVNSTNVHPIYMTESASDGGLSPDSPQWVMHIEPNEVNTHAHPMPSFPSCLLAPQCSAFH